MDRWKLWLLLLLPLGLCIDSEVTLVKTVGKGPDVTPVCTKEALLKVLCKISTERTRGENCRLGYEHEWGVVNKCDSRFTLTTENQTVFLHLTSLTPVDSGNYTCECSHTEGSDVLHLSVTVEASPEVQSSSSFSWISIIVICVPGVILGLILRKKCCKDDTRSEEPEFSVSVCEIPGSLDQDDPDDPDDLYDSLEQPANVVYENFSTCIEDDGKTNSASDNIETTDLEQEVDEKTDEEWEIYENI